MVGGELTEWFDVTSGTGQGDIQGPPVFNVCLNFAAQLAEQHKTVSRGLVLQVGYDEPDVTVMDKDYADDMAVLDNSEQGLQESTDLLSDYCRYAGLRVNSGKTKSMACGKNTGQRPYTEECTLDLTVDGEHIEQVSHFTYLGSILSSDGTIDKELTSRIGKASGAFNQLGSIWNNRNIRICTKVRIYKAAVITVLLYGSEAWSTTKMQVKRFEVFHQRCLRRILRIRWFHKVTNVEVLNRANACKMETMIGTMRLRWFGHVARMPSSRTAGFLLDWAPNYGKRTRGRPRASWISSVREDAGTFMKKKDVTITEMRDRAQDRVEWRQMIVTMRDRFPGAGHAVT